jgi:hypothetical protein
MRGVLEKTGLGVTRPSASPVCEAGGAAGVSALLNARPCSNAGSGVGGPKGSFAIAGALRILSTSGTRPKFSPGTFSVGKTSFPAHSRQQRRAIQRSNDRQLRPPLPALCSKRHWCRELCPGLAADQPRLQALGLTRQRPWQLALLPHALIRHPHLPVSLTLPCQGR